MKILRSKGKQSPLIFPILKDKDLLDYVWTCPHCKAEGTYKNPIVAIKGNKIHGEHTMVMCRNCGWEGAVKTAVITGGFKIDITKKQTKIDEEVKKRP